MSDTADNNRRPPDAEPVDMPTESGATTETDATTVGRMPARPAAGDGPAGVGALWRFYAPLGASQSLMTVSHAIINGSLNRTDNPIISLASYAIAMSVHMLSESPMVMLRQTGAALLRDRAGWPGFLRVAVLACLFNVLVSFAIAWTPLGHYVFHDVIGAPEEMVPAVIAVFRFSMVTVMFSTMRCVLHAVLLVNRKTLWITLGMTIRIAVMLALAVLCVKTGWLSDGRRGALIFMAGMAVEAISAVWSFRKWFHALPARAVVSGQPAAMAAHHSPLTTRRVWTFYLPLVLAALTGALAPSILSAGLARMHEPRMVIATFAQASVVTTLILGTLFLVHQVSLFFAVPPGAAGARERNRRVHRFCLQIGLGASAVLGVLAWTPAGDWLLLRCFQATPSMLPQVKQVLHLSMYLPLVLVWNEYRVGLLLAAGQSRVLTITKLCSVATLATVVFTLARWFPDLGAVAAPISSLSALTVEQTVLLQMTKRLKHG
ncbi:MAG: hypothetical protein HZA91_15575 [Verrucomicrobia bacterium]|nr:hypothetical protein [Verrucomicrobiota bacterium]